MAKLRGLITILFLIIIGTFIYNYYNKSSLFSLQGSTVNTLNLNHTGEERLYPNPNLTPGDVMTIDGNEVCKSGYASSVRNVPVEEKRQVYNEYGISYPQLEGSYEVDHFISLELGGSNDIKNLWPEPALPKPGFHEKDQVENYLHNEVCSGRISLEEAQREIREDWYKVYLKMQAENLLGK